MHNLWALNVENAKEVSKVKLIRQLSIFWVKKMETHILAFLLKNIILIQSMCIIF